MSKMSFTLPKPEPKTAKAKGSAGDVVVEGPFEVTTDAGRKLSWAIVETKQYGLLFHVEPDGAKPIRMGRGEGEAE